MTALFLSIEKISSLQLKKYSADLETLDFHDEASLRPTLQTQRLATLALMKSMLVEKRLYTEQEAQHIKIERLESGRPYLVSPTHRTDDLPFISMSHSGVWVACLLSDPKSPACIDIEDLARNRPIEKLARHAFTDKENQFVVEAGKLGFYLLWTTKEAIAKCRGKGLSDALKIDLSEELVHFQSMGKKKIKLPDGEYILDQKITSEDVMYTVAEKVSHSFS